MDGQTMLLTVWPLCHCAQNSDWLDNTHVDFILCRFDFRICRFNFIICRWRVPRLYWPSSVPPSVSFFVCRPRFRCILWLNLFYNHTTVTICSVVVFVCFIGIVVARGCCFRSLGSTSSGWQVLVVFVLPLSSSSSSSPSSSALRLVFECDDNKQSVKENAIEKNSTPIGKSPLTLMRPSDVLAALDVVSKGVLLFLVHFIFIWIFSHWELQWEK